MNGQFELFGKEVPPHKEISIASVTNSIVVPDDEDKKENMIFPDTERINCQYCEDVGVCTFCDRGRKELSNMHRSKMN